MKNRKRDIFSRTKFNIVLLSLGIVLLAIVSFALLTLNLFQKMTYKSIDNQLFAHRNSILRDIKLQRLEGELIEIELPPPMSSEVISFIWEEGYLIKGSAQAYKGDTQVPELNMQEEAYTLNSGTHAYRVLAFSYEKVMIQLLFNIDSQMEAFNQLKLVLVRAFLGIFILALDMSLYLATKVLLPIKKMYDRQLNFIQDASHEMRTPLAVVKGNMELLARNGEVSIASQYSIIGNMMEELSHIEKLNKDLLTLVKEDIGVKLCLEKVDAVAFIKDLVVFYIPLAQAEEKKMSFMALEENIEAFWDLEQTRRCLIILIENALKYTKVKDCISIGVIREGQKVKVTVQDSGIGISEEELKKVFNRFYRSNKVRALGIEGSGIGLSLLQAMAMSLSIKVSVTSKEGEGSAFCLEIPLKMR